MTDKLTHYISESSSCIALIFSSNVNLNEKLWCGTITYKICHHNIIYGTLNFDIPLFLPYFREICGYKNANIECIQKPIYIYFWLI